MLISSKKHALIPWCPAQVYVVADGGLDLEHFELRSFDELRSILLQASRVRAVMHEILQPTLWVPGLLGLSLF